MRPAPEPPPAWLAPQPSAPQPSAPQPPAPPAPSPRERSVVEWGIGALVLAHGHWIDKPSDRSVAVGSAAGTDGSYPGFFGLHAGLGAMLDVRFFRVVGVEVDLLRQEDRGSGSIEMSGSCACVILNNGPGAGSAEPRRYSLTLGQMAWHVPLLAKLSIETGGDPERDQEARRRSVSLVFGPELVFPEAATLEASPDGFPGPSRAQASRYLMLTGGIGFERQLTRAIDLRLVGSLRGSYNPSVGGGAGGRAEYEVVGGVIQPTSYRSEWRYQVWSSLGLGVFF